MAWGAPSKFAFQGQIIKPNGQALEATNVSFLVQLISPHSEECILYEETHTLNMSGSNGVFALTIGEGSRSGSDYQDTNSLSSALNNSSGPVSPTVCLSGTTYTPSVSDPRKLRLTFDDGGGPTTITQDHTINSVPYADSASSIDGLNSNELLKINTTGSYVLTQANIENVFDGANHTELLALIAGTSTQYLSGAPSAPFDVNSQRITNVATPVAGTDATNRTYVDGNIAGLGADTTTLSGLGLGDAGEVLFWNGTQWSAGSPSADPAKLSIDGSIAMTGDLDMGGNSVSNAANMILSGDLSAADLNISNNGVVVGDFSTNNLSVGNNAVVTTDLSVGNNASVTGDISVSGGIGVATGLTSAGRIQLDTANEVRFRDGTNTNYVGLRAPGVVTTSVTWTLPASDGSSGEVLSTDSTGVLSWVSNAQVDRGGDAMTGDLTMNNEGEVRFGDSGTAKYVGFKAPALITAPASFVWELPADDGTAGQVLRTNGSGVLSWVDSTTAIIGSTLNNATFWIGNGSNQAAEVSLSGDATLANTGVLTIANNSIDSNKLADDAVATANIVNSNVTNAKLADNAVTSLKILDNEIIDADIASGAAIAAVKIAGGGVDNTEFSYLDGVTSAIQTQLDSKLEASDITTKATLGGDNGAVVLGSNDNTLSLEANNNTVMSLLTDGKVGIGTTTPDFSLSIGDGVSEDGSLMAKGFGTLGVDGTDLTVSGAGTRMFWYPKKAAFRAGTVTGANFDDTNIGNNSVAFGYDSIATGSSSVAIGSLARAYGTGSVALGLNIQSGTNYSAAIGVDSTVSTSQRAFSFGSSNSVSGFNSIALGNAVGVSGSRSSGLGNEVSVSGNQSIGFGAGDPSANPVISGNNSVGFFLGDQTGANITNDNVFSILGGQVGIGSAAPSTLLDIAGTIKVADGSETCSVGADGGMIRYNAGNLQFCNGSAWQTLGVSGAGLTSLGGQTGSTQTFAAGSSGTSPAIASAGNTHTLNVPLASAGGTVTSGTISNADYVTFSNKLDAVAGSTLTDTHVFLGNGSNQAASVAISGDATLANTGVLTLADNAVTSLKILDNEIIDADIASGAAIAAVKIAGGGVDNTEFSYLDGVTSAIQTQLDSKLEASDITSKATLGGDSGAVVLGSNDNTLSLEANNSTAVTILANGNVGVGSTAPTANFIVYDNTSFSPVRSITQTAAINTSAGFSTLAPGARIDITSTGSGYPTSDNYDYYPSSNYIESNSGTDGLWVRSMVGPTKIGFRDAGPITGYVPALSTTTGGNVGIGTINPNDKLVVDGVIRNLAAINQSSNSTVDFSSGNIQYTTDSCGSFVFENVKSGGTYTFVVQGSTSATCSFTAWSGVTGSGPLTVHLPPGHGATVASRHTIYTAIVAGTHLYFAWIPDL